jgi:ribose 5-phosphate isomerase B
MKVAIGCDSAGYEMKLALMAFMKENGVDYLDMGCDGSSVDYPDIARNVCEKVLAKEADFGVLVCGTGIGMSIAANKIKGIRASVCENYYSAKYTRKHNDSNVLCLGGRTLGVELAKELLNVYLNETFDGGRHALRVDKITKLEE